MQYFAAIGLPERRYAHMFFQVSIRTIQLLLHLQLLTHFPLILQNTFAATCATIVSGAIAERCSFNGYIIFSSVVSGVVYPIIVHWCWSNDGWLRQYGYNGKNITKAHSKSNI